MPKPERKLSFSVWTVNGMKPGSKTRLKTVPEYQDTFSRIKLQKGCLPLFVAVCTAHNSELHHHDFAELSFVLEGSGTETINGRSHRMAPGVCSLLLPHQMHEFENDYATVVRKYSCMFDMNALPGAPYDAELGSQLLGVGRELPSSVMLSPQLARHMRGMFGLLLEEYERPGRISHGGLVRARLAEILFVFIRALHEDAASSASPAGGAGVARTGESSVKPVFFELLRYVHLHFADKLTLDILSGVFGVSAHYVSDAFRTHLGKSLLDYVHVLRIESAASRLRSTEMTITDIAYAVGFDSYRTFSRVFRELRGQTPSEYRRAGRT